MAPTVIAAIFSLVFQPHAPADLEEYIEVHLEAARKALETQ
jgi:hypothetical protein